jgi:hypothetical protein
MEANNGNDEVLMLGVALDDDSGVAAAAAGDGLFVLAALDDMLPLGVYIPSSFAYSYYEARLTFAIGPGTLVC